MIDKKKDNDFIVYLVSSVTFSYGLYLVFANNYLIDRFSLWVLNSIAENLIGVTFVAVACVKMVGLRTDNKFMKRIGIISMCILWAMVVGLYIFEALNLQFLGLIMTAPYLILCLRIARRGDFIE